ncbi:S4 domain-containing protein [Loa loa]|uniref:S4 domain-containing protein n=1 Tax=Loa loa TaxID=7209 RepID=A0A1I7V8Q9_LOALO|nr:S4 domain-containing protein [Loa loa]EFO23975.1 S4 domain-containing protein [Loa loa]
MTALTISRTSRLLRLNPISDCGTGNMLREFQTFAKLCASHRRPKTNIDIEITDDGLPKDYRLQVLKVTSRRLDSIVSKAIGQGRGQAEKLILTGRVQINEEDIPKKAAYYVQENDIIDIWKQPVEGNSKFAEVHRIEIINYALTEQGYDINLKSWKNFYVQNWRNRN